MAHCDVPSDVPYWGAAMCLAALCDISLMRCVVSRRCFMTAWPSRLKSGHSGSAQQFVPPLYPSVFARTGARNKASLGSGTVTPAAAAPVPGRRLSPALPPSPPQTVASMATELDTRCPICLDTWGSPAFTMPCCHQFCYPCIQRWADSKPECPLCKRRITSLVHSVQADDQFEELVISPSAVASADRPPVWAPITSVGGLPADTWGQLFREHPALLRPLLSWVRRELRSVFGARRLEALILENAVMESLRLFGLEEDLLVQLMELDLGHHAATFVSQLLEVAAQRCSREAHRLLGLNAPPAAQQREASPAPGPSGHGGVAPPPVPGPSPQPASSSGDEVPASSRDGLRGNASHPHSTSAAVPMEQAAPPEEPQEAAAGPSSARRGRGCPPGGPRRAPKRKNNSSQASAPPKKRPPRRQ
ncbi:E3 ubiquitin-protein ligase Topors-like isoform X2 [Aix galericulata]|nr:E3 ubiquitin-protein ligase Topors-like isoform X2 [Aix galericulata]